MQKANARSIVFGATGVVGGQILRQLVVRGEFRPLALSRKRREDDVVEWICGDLAAPSTFVVPPVRTIYCTLEVWLLAAALPRLYTPALKRVVVFTSTSITTKMESEIPSERELLKRLADGERMLMASCEALGVEWTILRPTLIYAEGRDGNVTRLARLIRKFGVLPLMGRAAGLRQPVHAEDLGIGAIQAAASAVAANKVYALPGGEILSYREMVGRIFDALGQPRRMISLPPALWSLGFTLLRSFFPNANVAMGRRMEKDMIFDASPAISAFGWSARDFRPSFDGIVWD